jgi:predicted MPP superfamily phosphohydrolase
VPRLQTVFSARLSNIEALRLEAAEFANELAAYYADPRSIAPGGGLPNTYRVLHIGDLHLDPVGAELARSFARSYDASLVVDTGDIAILGTAEEARLLPSLVVTDTPVVFVAGNHDSSTVLEALSALPNFTVATTQSVEVDGLRILPVPDPAGREPGIESIPGQVEELTAMALRRIQTEQAVGLPPYDIVALHNPVAERQLIDRVPLILSGHTHSGRLYRSGGTVRLNSGTIGGMPYDPVITRRERLPHGASILYFTADLPRRLIAIDRVSVGVDGTTTLDRTVVDESLLP